MYPEKRNCAFLKQSDSKIYLEDSPENLQTQYMATRSSLKDVLVSWDERGHVLFAIVLERCLCSRNHLNSHSSSIFTGASSPCSSSGPLSTQVLSSWYEVLQHKLRDVVKRFETCMVTMYHVLHTIHVLYICLHGWLIFHDECVGTYTIPVDALSYGCPMTVVQLLPDFSGPSKVWMDSPPESETARVPEKFMTNYPQRQALPSNQFPTHHFSGTFFFFLGGECRWFAAPKQ